VASPKLRRDSTRVIFDILNLAKRNVNKTQIVHQANLNFNLAKPYLEFLISKGFIVENSRIEHGSRCYHLTQKGDELLLLLREVQNRLNGLFDARDDLPPPLASHYQIGNLKLIVN